jgi:hypothetical protein
MSPTQKRTKGRALVWSSEFTTTKLTPPPKEGSAEMAAGLKYSMRFAGLKNILKIDLQLQLEAC